MLRKICFLLLCVHGSNILGSSCAGSVDLAEVVRVYGSMDWSQIMTQLVSLGADGCYSWSAFGLTTCGYSFFQVKSWKS